MADYSLPKTNAIRDHDTVTFVPHVIPVPEVDLKDFLRQAVGDIVTLLQHPPTSARLGLDAGDKTRNALLELASIFGTMEPLPPSSAPTTIPKVLPTVPEVTTIVPPPRVPIIAPPPRVLIVPTQPATPSVIPHPSSTSTTDLPLGLGLPKSKPSSLTLHQFLCKHAPPKHTSLLNQLHIILPRHQLHNFRARASTYLLAQQIFNLQPLVNHIYNAGGK